MLANEVSRNNFGWNSSQTCIMHRKAWEKPLPKQAWKHTAQPPAAGRIADWWPSCCFSGFATVFVPGFCWQLPVTEHSRGNKHRLIPAGIWVRQLLLQDLLSPWHSGSLVWSLEVRPGWKRPSADLINIQRRQDPLVNKGWPWGSQGRLTTYKGQLIYTMVFQGQNK